MVSYQYRERLNELDEQLVKEMRLLQQLLALSKDEQDILSRGDSDKLMPVVEEKEAIIDQIVLVEELKQTSMNQLAQEINLSPLPHSLDDLMNVIGGEEASHMRKLADGISAIASRIREVNQGSHALARENLKVAYTVQAFMLNMQTGEDNYSPKKPVVHPYVLPQNGSGVHTA